MKAIAGLGKIAHRYDAFLIDQFGVIHDGARLYPAAADTLSELHRRGKPVVILTNSGKRSIANRRRILDMGVAPEWFADVVSSGDVAWHGLRESPPPPGTGVAIAGRHGEDYGFGDLGLRFTADFGEAGLILILGSDAPRTSLADYRRLLAAAAARGVPALCCNPDREMLTPRGLAPAPGAIAEVYEALGGPVTWIGKPHAPVYRRALSAIGNPPPGRVLCIGDSVAHDVRGGRGAGLAAALVRTGVSAPLDDAALADAIAREGVSPDWLLPSLRW